VLLRGGEPLEERLPDVPGAECGRVRVAAGPVDPVLIWVAGRAAVLLELGVVVAIGNDGVAAAET
jgi:hypothetical protein